MNRINELVTRSGLVLALLLVGPGCLNLEPKTNPTRYYLLGGAWEKRSTPAEPNGLSIGLRKLNLAAYLESPRMVVREGPHEIRFAEFHRWGEDLPRGINRSVAGYLAAQAAVQRVDVVPWSRHVEHDYLVQLRVLRFEGVASNAAPSSTEGEVHLLITWEITDPADGRVLASGTSDYREEGWEVDRYDALAAMLDAGLEALSADLVTHLAALPR